MRVLLDTDIVMRGEMSAHQYCRVKRLYRWMDAAKARRVIHPLTAKWVEPRSRSYQTLSTVQKPCAQPADALTQHFGALLEGKADIFVTESNYSRIAAGQFGLGGRVLSIDQFIRLAAAIALNAPRLGELAVHEEYFSDIDVGSPFFDSLRRDYLGFDRWFAKKAAQKAHVCRDYDGELLGFLYLKHEGEDECYDDISPLLPKASRLKLGTLKVACSGLGLGGQFMRLALDTAVRQGVRQVYTTLFSGRRELDALMTFLLKWGFTPHGVKRGACGEEVVMLRPVPTGGGRLS